MGVVLPSMKYRGMELWIRDMVNQWSDLTEYQRISLLRIPDLNVNFDIGYPFLDHVGKIRVLTEEGNLLYQVKKTGWGDIKLYKQMNFYYLGKF